MVPTRTTRIVRLAVAAVAGLAGVGVFTGIADASQTYGPPKETTDQAPDTCRQGFVWREAWAGDRTCVIPAHRAQAAEDNAAAAGRVDPNGAYGPQSCKSPYVWREGRPGDMVCVTTARRQETRDDNELGPDRRAALNVWMGVRNERIVVSGSHFNLDRVHVLIRKNTGEMVTHGIDMAEHNNGFAGGSFGFSTHLLGNCRGEPNAYARVYDYSSKRWSKKVPVRVGCSTF